MTEFYVSSHIHSKSHFIKKVFQTKHLQKTLQSHVKKKLPSALKRAKGNKKKSTQVIQAGYEHYKIHGDAIKKCSNSDDQNDLTARRSLPATRAYEVRNEMVDQNVAIKQEPQYHISARENCKTPENVEEYKVKGDTLKKCRHDYTNILLEGCSDIEPSPTCTPDLREQVKQRLFESHGQDENEELGGIPQNLMDVIGFDYDWDVDSMLAGDVIEANLFVETAEMPQEIFSKEQNQLETPTVYPIQVVSGHNHNQFALIVTFCITATYKNYASGQNSAV